MTPVKPTNAVVALVDLLSSTVQEYEQRLAGQQDALNATAVQLKETSAALQASEQRAVAAMLRARGFVSALSADVQSADNPQGRSRDLVSGWLKEIVECLTPPPQAGPSGAPSRPTT